MKTIVTSLAFAFMTAATAWSQTVVVTNGRVVTNTQQGIIENGSVLIRDGRIAAVGTDFEIPDNAEIIDADGGWITPGLFHPYTRLGLSEVGAESSTQDLSADDSPFSASISVEDGFYPDSRYIQEARIDGITRFAVYPGFASSMIAGMGGIANSTGEADSLYTTNAFTFIHLGRSGGNLAGGSKPAAWAYLEAAMDDARAYPGRYLNTQDGLVLNRRDAAAFVPVVTGRRLLVIAVDSEMDICRVIDFKQANPAIRLAIMGGAEAHTVATELAEADIPVIVDPISNLPGSFDTIQSTLSNVSRLVDAGVDVSINSASSGTELNARLLHQHAGTAVAYGTDWEAAFAAISSNPARLFGQGDQYGSLATGYAGDVVVWDGDPLEVMSAPRVVLIDGEIQSMETRQTRLRDRYSEVRDNHSYAYH